MATTATSSDQRVERSDHSFVHSDRTTRGLGDAAARCVDDPAA